MTRLTDLKEICQMKVDYVGFIFYEKSGRFVEGKVSPEAVRNLEGIKKIGVFVNAEEAYILKKVKEYGLDLIQLHGEEKPEFCRRLRRDIPVIKAFKIRTENDIKATERYAGSCDYFLFDTAGKLYGGNGELFDWNLLTRYKGPTPFFLSGGIGPGEVAALKKFEHPYWQSIDINSRFEEEPGKKNTLKIKRFLGDMNKK